MLAKLQLKDQKEVVLLSAPPTVELGLDDLHGVRIVTDLRDAGPVGFALAFVTTQQALDEAARALIARADGDAVLWFAYPKASARRYTCEFTRDTGWQVLGDAGYEPVRQVAIDADWSALRFRKVEYIRTLRRDPRRALSREGQTRAGGHGAGKPRRQA